MDPHYLPSLYPGIFIGLIVGLASGGISNVSIGTLGGLLGAVLALEVNRWIDVGSDFVSFVVLVLFSIVGAKALLFGIELARKNYTRKE